FSGEAYLNWDPCGNLLSMTASNGTLVASYEYDKAYSKKINEYNPYGVEMPFQYKGRDGTVTPTYGGATPLNVDMQVLSGSSINVNNTTPLQANSKFCCYIDGYSEDPTSPVDDGAEDDCDDSSCSCQNMNARYFFHPSNIDWVPGIDTKPDGTPYLTLVSKLNQKSEQRLRDSGLDEDVVNRTSRIAGLCLEAGGKAECYQYECDGYCGMKCECSVPTEDNIDNQDPCFK
ncbi:MAG: hypothetical protein KAH01_07565, partial [Caldisericia bacterium]|nr:hypothetical protein [Caldisericia bacterium]